MIKRIITLLIVLFGCSTANAQTPPDNIFGLEFRNWVKTNFYDGKYEQQGYNHAKDLLYFYIENFNDTVECVYSGYKKFVEGNVIGVNPDPINTEHIVPQSLFDESEPMRGDLHILYPAYDTWNTKRSNNPYMEINDNNTDEWIIKDLSTTTIPSTNRDAYSENLSGFAWEPREIRKGDIARAVFYFFTMYPAFSIDFVGDQEMFCNWHENDPVDGREMSRNDDILAFQKNENPYVNHPQWANQAWGCEVVVLGLKLNENSINVNPNPATNRLNITLEGWNNYPLNAEVFNTNGQLMHSFIIKTNQTIVDISNFPSANYVLTLKDVNNELIGNKHIIIQQ